MVLGGSTDASVSNLNKLVHDVSLQVASYRQAVQVVGTGGDCVAVRRELEASRRQCLKACDNTKNSMLPQLRSETHEGVQSSEFTKQASQFIGCLSAFVNEMRRYESLVHTFPTSATASSADLGRAGPSAAVDSDAAVTGASSPQRHDSEHQQLLHALCRDCEQATEILEQLENLITVHFSTKDQPGDKVEPPRRRGKGCRFDCICSNFKTSYA
uniref:Uncharacterized protein n=1 Tax=Plectus sambesii TaxID=2011161 RepID=A0A914V6P8_9BILA